ncbi:peptidoglycan-binding protein [Actinoplanes couchii]|uniref:Peptidoglycan-binding protein n=1 Tax=Actinoplanes couchii TaxID=403638 RepID=A0ABQ3WZI5_9ACTN|nr:peptidoglycan-binding protein [Actinoplanes couchii]MDR6316082.1 peptidoglycan hydrolase-like protein with peptidoglycan-binding domain [Actinoplanes couchii]GID51696.1 peptidoglycan-binding protein [Actinoplanes couchii]
MSRRRTAAVVGGVVAVGAVVTAVTVFSLANTDESPTTAGTAPISTAEVTKETLVDRESHDGTLAHGDSTTISARGGGTITALPMEGSTISRGKWIYRIDNKPVTLLYGTLPAYRTLKTGVKGADVKQFEQNLWALGYRGFTPDTTYSWVTASVVKDWQDDLGLKKTGTVEAGQIVYTDGTVRVDSLTVQRGTVVGQGTEIEKITGTSPLATVVLDASSGRLATAGAAVQIELSDGKVVPGKVKKVATLVAKADDGQTDTTKFQATISFDDDVESQGMAAVSVAFTAGQRPDVLTVPVAALVALAEGGYGVQVVDGTATSVVAVETGLFADGKVEITGTGLAAGTKVAMPS